MHSKRTNIKRSLVGRPFIFILFFYRGYLAFSRYTNYLENRSPKKCYRRTRYDVSYISSSDCRGRRAAVRIKCKFVNNARIILRSIELFVLTPRYYNTLSIWNNPNDKYDIWSARGTERDFNVMKHFYFCLFFYETPPAIIIRSGFWSGHFRNVVHKLLLLLTDTDEINTYLLRSEYNFNV